MLPFVTLDFCVARSVTTQRGDGILFHSYTEARSHIYSHAEDPAVGRSHVAAEIVTLAPQVGRLIGRAVADVSEVRERTRDGAVPTGEASSESTQDDGEEESSTGEPTEE